MNKNKSIKSFSKKALLTILALSMPLPFVGCKKAEANRDTKKISIVCTNFPEYDFAKQIVKDKADVKMLLKPGAESHSFEPSPKDIIDIKKSDVFMYAGGDSDEWVDKILSSMKKKKNQTFKLMDQVKLSEEEHPEGMEEEKEEEGDEKEEGPEMDEHVWTSPKNAIKIVNNLEKKLSKLSPENKTIFKANAKSYINKLSKLDKQFRNVIKNAKRKEIVVGDRFPFLYFCKEYGLKYYGAFPGCSKDTDASAKTIAFLVNKVKEDKIPVVFHIEFSNEKVCNSICESTKAKKMLLNAIHNVTSKQFKDKVTYVSLMEHNVKALKEALN